MPASPKIPELVAVERRALRGAAVWLALLAIVAASSLTYLHIVDMRFMPASHSDLLPRWVGTRAALHGESPYSADVLRQIQTAYYGRPLTGADHVNPQAFFYPATIIPLLTPLAALSWPAARLAFLLVTIPLLALGFWVCMRMLELPSSRFGRVVALLLACVSWAVIWGLRQQQPGLPVVIAIFFACFLLSRRGQAVPGVLLAMATIKPQLALPLLVWLLVWAVVRRMWVFVASFAGAFALLLAVTAWMAPGWFPAWRAQMRAYRGITHTSLPLEWSLGHWPGIVATAIIAGASAWVLWKLRRCEPESPQFGLAVALALAVTTTFILGDPSLIYNDILLFPACLILIFGKAEGQLAGIVRMLALVQIAWDFVAVPLAIAGTTYGKSAGFWVSLPFRDYFLPLLATLAVLFAAARMTALPWFGEAHRADEAAQAS